MKKTAFHAIHQQLGAKLVEFGGFEMPVQYSGIIDEHLTVRNAVGVFDVSHMGEFEIRGPDALTLVQRVTTNDASKLTVGKVQYSAMCYPDGGIVDDLLVYRLPDRFMLVVNASNCLKDYEWIRSNIGTLRAELIDRSDATSLLAVQGPRSRSVMERVTKTDLNQLAYYAFIEKKIDGVDMIISRTGYTGELGYEVYFSSDPLPGGRIWNAVMEEGKAAGIKPIGLGARDTLRLEMGFCLYGNDIDQTTNPLEAGLGWITKLEKGDFIGRPAILKTKEAGLTRKLAGFIVNDQKAFPRHGYPISRNATAIGHVTSGTISPVLEIGIGMGYVPVEVAKAGEVIDIGIRNRSVSGRITQIPFIKKQ